MGDLGDMLGLGPAQRRPRPRTRCRDCSRPVYVDQLMFGLGRCCAEKAGLVVRRHRLATGPQAGETLLDLLPKENRVEPYPQVRIDVTDLEPEDAHRKIVEHTRSMIMAGDHVSPLGAMPAQVIEAANDQWHGIVAILERHAPDVDRSSGPWCSHPFTGERWPCPDYRDVTRGLATGLPEPFHPTGSTPAGRRNYVAEAYQRRELAEPDQTHARHRTDDGDPHAGTIAAL